MRKLRIAAMALTIALVAAVGASAAAGQTEHYKLQGATAQAIWLHGNTFTLVDAQSDSVFGTIVFFDRFTPHFDQHGNFIGGTDVSGAAVGRRVSLSLGKLLSSATLTASIPIKRCTITASGNETGCTREGSIALTLAFTGVGPTAHGGSNDHFHYPGVTITDHLVGTQREATVTGTIAGQHVLARDLQEAIIGHLQGGGLYLCHGC
jgi:hypothetical protein